MRYSTRCCRTWSAARDDVILIDVDVIEDPVEARRRIDRFLERAARRDAYGELLARGQVSRHLDDPTARENLRSELRRQESRPQQAIPRKRTGRFTPRSTGEPIFA